MGNAAGDLVGIRAATLADVAALALFAERVFRDAFEADNNPADMAAYCAEAFTLDVQRAIVTDPAVDTLLVEDVNSSLIAYAQLRPGSPPGMSCPPPLELWRFYVDRAHHGRGIAQALMVAVVDAAKARGAKTLWLGVWERNLRAQAFYRKAGFVDIGAHTFVLGNDVQTDRLMALTLD